MQRMSVHVWFMMGAIVMASAGCGAVDPDGAAAGEDTALSTSTAAVGSTCSPQGTLVSPVVRRTIGYGQMGKYGIYDWYDSGGTPICAWFEDQCGTGLWPQNVDTQSSPLYAKAAPGNFSCWGNTPDVICWEFPRINNYIYVRECYVRPDGSWVNYGCGCP